MQKDNVIINATATNEDKSSLKKIWDELPFSKKLVFRDTITELCGWTDDQWENRLYNRTKTTPAENHILKTEYQKLIGGTNE